MGKPTPTGQKSLLAFFSKSPRPQTPNFAPKLENKPRASSCDTSIASSDGSETLTTPPQSSKSQPNPESKLPSSPLARKRAAVESDSEEEDLALVSTKAYENPVPSSPVIKEEQALGKINSTLGPSSLAQFDSKSNYIAKARTQSPPKKLRLEEPDGRYKWILQAKDADGNPEGSENYDHRTILIPSSAWASFTAFEKQYWEIKKNLWDTIVFFKKGKFYELYEKDALIGHSQFDLRLAGGGRANMQCAGIPEMSFDYWASAFIAKGYKVAKVDQKETALAKEMRDQAAAGKKEEKIIRRELSFILTAGTLTEEAMLVDDLSQFCMAVKQYGTEFAVAFVDTSTGAFSLSNFTDGEDLNQFETLIAQTRPRELILERGNLSRYAEKIIKNNSSVDTLWNIVKPGEEFLDAETAVYQLAAGKYFGEDMDDTSSYPSALVEAKKSPLLMSTVGALLNYLKVLKLDKQLVSLGNFKEYKAVQRTGPMIVDGQTLQNLEIFANTFDQGTEGTLFRLLNKCVTPFGKRRLKSWVSHPLKDLPQIRARQQAVDLLLNQTELREYIEGHLSGIADVERLLSRIHAGRLPPKDFVRVIHGIESMNALKNFIMKQDVSGLIVDLCAKTPELDDLVAEWMNAFDHGEATTNGTLNPEPGIEVEFDATKKVITDAEADLEALLKQYRKQFNSLSICYRDSGKEIYLIEIPGKVNVPSNWQQMAATKQVKRYWSPEVRSLVRQLQEAREHHKIACQKVQQKLYTRFTTEYSSWITLVTAFADIDCLLSLARVSQSMPTKCLPIFKEHKRSFVNFEDLVHPCNPEFIPNHIQLGGDEPKMSLLTGANAAGKSTVLRSAGCAVIMAQLGCYVPARSAELTTIDRIMTRLGANDNIFAGKSTFHVELSETQRILSEATENSLVVIDELGRGGSSSDGFAIAESVLHHLATHIGCLGYFATHYGTLYKSFSSHPEVKPERMAILVNQESREVTFLYKLEGGQSEGSFGMNVAAMCGVDASIVEAAQTAAQTYEHTQRLNKLGYQTVPIGLQSDIIWQLRHMPTEEALRIVMNMAKSINI